MREAQTRRRSEAKPPQLIGQIHLLPGRRPAARGQRAKIINPERVAIFAVHSVGVPSKNRFPLYGSPKSGEWNVC